MTPQLPILFLVGFPKTGTSSLFSWLSDHPQVLGSIQKESRFFVDPGSHVFDKAFNAAKGPDGFAAAFPRPAPETKLLLEGTPTHAYSQTALTHIPAMPQAKCLFLLRDPAEQIRSLYDYFRNTWDYIPAGMSFGNYIDTAAQSGQDFGGNELAANPLLGADYLHWLGPWHEALGSARMKVFTFERLRDDPVQLLEEIATWCGLEADFYARYAFPRENESYVPRNRMLQRLNIALRGHLPKGRLYDGARAIYRRLNTQAPDRMEESETMARLQAHFADRNALIAQTYGLDLSSWSSAPRKSSSQMS